MYNKADWGGLPGDRNKGEKRTRIPDRGMVLWKQRSVCTRFPQGAHKGVRHGGPHLVSQVRGISHDQTWRDTCHSQTHLGRVSQTLTVLALRAMQSLVQQPKPCCCAVKAAVAATQVNEQNCVPIKLYLQTQEVCQMCSNKTLFTNTGRMPDVALASAGRPLIATFTSTSFKWQTKGKQMSSRPTSGNGLIS